MSNINSTTWYKISYLINQNAIGSISRFTNSESYRIYFTRMEHVTAPRSVDISYMYTRYLVFLCTHAPIGCIHRRSTNSMTWIPVATDLWIHPVLLGTAQQHHTSLQHIKIMLSCNYRCESQTINSSDSVVRLNLNGAKNSTAKSQKGDASVVGIYSERILPARLHPPAGGEGGEGV